MIGGKVFNKFAPFDPPLKQALACGDCHTPIRDDQYATEINPARGYGRPQMVVCDTCMASGRWDHWIAVHWPNWPEPRT